MAFEYQAEGTAFLKAKDRAFLADDMGLGKSKQLLEAATPPVLVLAPAMVLDSGVWADETTRWRPDLEYGVDVVPCAYTYLCDRVRTPKGGSTPIGTPRPQFASDWATLILDESQFVKERKTSWTKAALSLAPRADRVWLASGTPFPNWAHELFTSLQLLFPADCRPGHRFGSYWRWVAEWFECGPDRYSPMAVGPFLDDTDTGWQRFYSSNFGDRLLRREYEKVYTELPPMRFQVIHCPMTPPQRKAYAELRKQYLTVLDSGSEVVAWSDGGVHTKLFQVTTGLDLFEPDARLPFKQSAKLLQLAELLGQRHRPTLVVGHFRRTCELARQVAQAVGHTTAMVHGGTSRPDRQRAIADFKAGRASVLIGSIETVAEGLTLTQADCVIRIERSWRPSRNQQVARRIHRIGQDRPTLCLDLVCPRSVDEAMVRVLGTKTDQQVRFMQAAEFASLL